MEVCKRLQGQASSKIKEAPCTCASAAKNMVLAPWSSRMDPLAAAWGVVWGRSHPFYVNSYETWIVFCWALRIPMAITSGICIFITLRLTELQNLPLVIFFGSNSRNLITKKRWMAWIFEMHHLPLTFCGPHAKKQKKTNHFHHFPFCLSACHQKELGVSW